MKLPLIFKGDADYVYASGVVRGLEPYLLTKADYQKLLDAQPNQVPVVLSELGYGGGEHNPEDALDNAIQRLLTQVERMSHHKEFTNTIGLRYDFAKVAVILKAHFLSEPIATLPHWGTIPTDTLSASIDAVLAGENTTLPEPIVTGIALSKRYFSAYNSALAVDMALDKTYAEYLHSVIPDGEYFARWMAIYADWLNTKALARIIASEMPSRMLLDIIIPGGDIPTDRFAEIVRGEPEHIPSVLAVSEYGKALANVFRAAVSEKPAGIDVFFRMKLISLYRYTRYCPYGLELLWAYALLRLEEIGVLRTILRAKAAEIPIDLIREVISIVVE